MTLNRTTAARPRSPTSPLIFLGQTDNVVVVERCQRQRCNGRDRHYPRNRRLASNGDRLSPSHDVFVEHDHVAPAGPPEQADTIGKG